MPEYFKWPSLKDLIYYGPEGLAMLFGAGLVGWGLFMEWPPTWGSRRLWFGLALVLWSRTAHYWSHATSVLSVGSKSERFFHFPSIVFCLLTAVLGALCFLAFYVSGNPFQWLAAQT